MNYEMKIEMSLYDGEMTLHEDNVDKVKVKMDDGQVYIGWVSTLDRGAIQVELDLTNDEVYVDLKNVKSVELLESEEEE